MACPPPYENRARARAALRRMGYRRLRGMHARHCRACGGWHIHLRWRTRRARLLDAA